jgi:hypothetical protein
MRQPTTFMNTVYALLLGVVFCCTCAVNTAFAQPNTQNQINHGRLRGVVITESILVTAGMIGLHYLWYKKFPRSRFHLFNDNAEWRYMDKIGHAATGYNLSAVQYDMMRWSGLSNANATIVAGLTALALQTVVEIFDGHSQQWGFSKGDMLANILGTAFFAGQQFAWGEQRIRLKFSFHKTIYANYHPAELGANKWQSWLKDYNGQTYWLSVNPSSFMSANTSFPKWLSFSFGYGADGMTGARTNPSQVKGVNIPSFNRTSRYLFSLDADLKRISNPNMDPRILLTVPNILKVPAPTLELKKGSKARYYWWYF